MQINLIEQKIIITKDTILGANKSFFSQNKLSPEIFKKLFSINMQIQNVIETYK